MNIELLILLILLVSMLCVAYWYARRVKNNRWLPLQSDVTQSVLSSSAQALLDRDPFLQQVASYKVQIDETIITSVQQHERELEQQFASDVEHVQRKEQLSQFAWWVGLDKALIGLWEEIEHYPLWLKSEDLDKWNKLNLKDISGSSKENTYSVEFIYGTQHFKIIELTQDGPGELNSVLSFFEDDVEVFAIECLISAIDEETEHICQNICAFKKSGNWPKILLEYYGQIKIEKAKSANTMKYFRVGEFKSRFEG